MSATFQPIKAGLLARKVNQHQRRRQRNSPGETRANGKLLGVVNPAIGDPRIDNDGRQHRKAADNQSRAKLWYFKDGRDKGDADGIGQDRQQDRIQHIQRHACQLHDMFPRVRVPGCPVSCLLQTIAER